MYRVRVAYSDVTTNPRLSDQTVKRGSASKKVSVGTKPREVTVPH